MANQVAGHQAKVADARGKNNAKLKNYHRQNKEYDVTANLDNVQYLNDVQEQDVQQDLTYQAMLDQWTDTDVELKKVFAENDFAIEDAIVEMHKNSYAGSQTGATAARLAGAPVMEKGRQVARSIHAKMFAVDEANRQKSKTHRAAKNDSYKLFNDVRFSPVHGFRPAKPDMVAGPSKASLILGLAETGYQGYTDFKANRADNVLSDSSEEGGGAKA